MVCNLFTLLFKPPSCNGPETELECKTGFRNYLNNICILSYTDNWCLVPFCINISGDSPHRMCRVLTTGTPAVVGKGGLESWVHSKKILTQITPS